MKAAMKVEDPGNLEITLTMTTSLAAWRQVRDALRDARWMGVPSQMADTISRTISSVEQVFEPGTPPAGKIVIPE